MARSSLRHVALLRGINVGGKHIVKMANLRRLFEAAGATEVATHLQSGNVIFRAARTRLGAIARRVDAALENEFGFSAPIVTRRGAEFAAAVEAYPFTAPAKERHIGFCATEPTAVAIASLDPNRSPPDRFAIDDSHVYLHCPNGMARTKLTNDYFDRALGTTTTFRNWNTAQRLIEMIQAS